MYREQDSWQTQLIFTLGLLIIVILLMVLLPDSLLRWQAVLPYLIDTNSQPVLSPVDGKVLLNLQTLSILAEPSGEVLAEWPKTYFEQIIVDDGSYILSGNALGFHDTWAFGTLASGAGVTLVLTVLAFILAMLIGFVVGSMLVSTVFLVRSVASAMVAFFHGIPPLVHIFIAYYLLSEILLFSRFTAAVLALAAYNAVYIAEMVRKALLDLPAGQFLAARSLGISSWHSLYYIFLPQVAWRLLLPLLDQLIRLFKHSSLVSVIAIMDLTRAGQEVINVTLYPLEVWLTVALIYLFITRMIMIFARYLATIMPAYAVNHAGSLGHMKIQPKSVEVKSFNIERSD